MRLRLVIALTSSSSRGIGECDDGLMDSLMFFEFSSGLITQYGLLGSMSPPSLAAGS